MVVEIAVVYIRFIIGKLQMSSRCMRVCIQMNDKLQNRQILKVFQHINEGRTQFWHTPVALCSNPITEVHIPFGKAKLFGLPFCLMFVTLT